MTKSAETILKNLATEVQKYQDNVKFVTDVGGSFDRAIGQYLNEAKQNTEIAEDDELVVYATKIVVNEKRILDLQVSLNDARTNQWDLLKHNVTDVNSYLEEN